jgi:hypothetical protein
MVPPHGDDLRSDRPLPGTLVRNPAQPDWGVGQVQSAIGSRITVNFENVGKLLINGDAVRLEPVDPDMAPQGSPVEAGGRRVNRKRTD